MSLTCVWLELPWRHYILLAVARWIQYLGLMMSVHSAGITSLWFNSVSVLPSSLLSRETEGEDEKPFWHPRHPGDHIGPHHSKSAHPGKGAGGFRWWSDWLLCVCLVRLLMMQGRDNQLTTGSVAGSYSKINETDWIQSCISHLEIQPSIN